MFFFKFDYTLKSMRCGNNKIKSVFVVGPTASGKTRLGVALCRKFNGEILSVDSRQVYRKLDIGSGKDISEFGKDGDLIPYHLIDISDASDEYNLMQFMRDFMNAIVSVFSKGKLPVACGGTAMYISAILNGYLLPGGPPDQELRKSISVLSNQEIAAKILEKSKEGTINLDINNRNRLIRIYERSLGGLSSAPCIRTNMDWLILAPFYDRREIHRRIEARLEARLKAGMVDEVSELHANGLSWTKLEFFGLEYRWIALYLQERIDFADMKAKLLAGIRQLARKQDIWFRKLEKQGWIIHWIRDGDIGKASELVEAFIANEKLPRPEIRISEIKYGR